MIKKIGLVVLFAVSAFAMHTVELNINDKDMEIGAKLDMGQFSDSTEPNTVFIGGKFLHGDEDHSDFVSNSDIQDYFELNFLMKKEINESFTMGLGIKANYTDDFTSFPLGMEVNYQLPFKWSIPVSIGGYLYYAPEVLSIRDAKSFLEYRAEIDAEVITNGHVVVGYRNLDTNYDSNNGGDINYNKSPYIGFRFAF